MLVQIALYVSNSFFGIIKTNGLIALSKYPIKCLELVFVLTNFEITILSTLTSKIFIGLFATIKLFFCYFFLSESHHCYTMNKNL